MVLRNVALEGKTALFEKRGVRELGPLAGGMW